MTIRNAEELNLFEETLKKCRKTVAIVAGNGTEYEMDKPQDYAKGLACLIEEDPEVFANCAEDEMLLFDFIEKTRALAA